MASWDEVMILMSFAEQALLHDPDFISGVPYVLSDTQHGMVIETRQHDQAPMASLRMIDEAEPILKTRRSRRARYISARAASANREDADNGSQTSSSFSKDDQSDEGTAISEPTPPQSSQASNRSYILKSAKAKQRKKSNAKEENYKKDMLGNKSSQKYTGLKADLRLVLDRHFARNSGQGFNSDQIRSLLIAYLNDEKRVSHGPMDQSFRKVLMEFHRGVQGKNGKNKGIWLEKRGKLYHCLPESL